MGTPDVRLIHVIFKTHLDVGFTELAREVVAGYFQRYIPDAMSLARMLREGGGDERFIWTTGSWLIYDYLERATMVQRRQMEQAIVAGDIVWHGLPFTTHSELIDSSLFAAGLDLSQELDRRFGRRTIAAKMTDVPGHTRGIVPIMAAAGVRFLHIGVNQACTPPDVPPVFVWRDPSGASLMVMYHKGTYGDLMVVPGLDEAILFAHTNDNAGPQTADDVFSVFAQARQQFPQAVVMASTMDAFARSLDSIRAELPVITAEIGDTWIHGAGSDPAKMARYRAVSRLRRDWLTGSRVTPGEIGAFSRRLLLVPEHTWGLDEKTHLNDSIHYTAADLAAARGLPAFQKMEESWAEQRAYIDEAIAALPHPDLIAEAHRCLQETEPIRPDLVGYTPISDLSAALETAHFIVQLDPSLGAICLLRDRRTCHDWADNEHLLGLFRYETFSHDDYLRFWDQYVINKRETEEWSWPDLTKPGIEVLGLVHQQWHPILQAAYWKDNEIGHQLLIQLTMPPDTTIAFGAPQDLRIEWTFPRDTAEAHLTLQWFDKPACRLPEAAWLSFAPRIADPSGWLLDKMDQRISPLGVISHGNRRLHAVDSGVYYTHHERSLAIITRDAPLVALGGPSLLDFNNTFPDLNSGMAFNLINNVWGTNFRMWYDEDARFRFTLRCT